MDNHYSRYINVLTIEILCFSMSFKIGNPLWFIQEFKNIVKESR